MDYKHLYHRVSVAIDVVGIVGIPLVVGILINPLLGIGVLAILGTVTVLRKRFLDKGAEKVVLGVLPSAEQKGKVGFQADRRSADRRSVKPLRRMVLAALVATCLVAIRVVVTFGVGSIFPKISVYSILIVWFGVAIVALGYHIGRRHR
jgi:hypothetical protein